MPPLSNYAALLDILSEIRFYCTWFHTMQDTLEPGLTVGGRCPPSIGDLATLRDSIEHRLLAYMITDNSVEEQLCWTIALIFTQCVIYPLPNRQPLEILLDRLVTSLCTMDTSDHDDAHDSFLAWVSMIAAMACHASDKARRRLFLIRLRECVTRLGVSSWVQLRSLLQGFLWLDRACDAGGLVVWGMLAESAPGTVLIA